MSLVERYKACMVLAGVGDAIGVFPSSVPITSKLLSTLHMQVTGMDCGNSRLIVRCDHNELLFHKSYIFVMGTAYRIQAELKDLGGLENLDLRGWKVSDDQVMHLATAEALLECTDWQDITEVCKFIAKHYVLSFNDMIGRAPGGATSVAISLLEKGRAWNCTFSTALKNTQKKCGFINEIEALPALMSRRLLIFTLTNNAISAIPFSSGAGGCGAAMRAMCIGLVFCGENLRDWLIRVAIESGRMTHNHPTGFFGALGSVCYPIFLHSYFNRNLVTSLPMLGCFYSICCGRKASSAMGTIAR